jgi:hypothetical protein
MNSRNAWPKEARAGVNTGDVFQRERGTDSSPQVGWPGLRNSQPMVTASISAAGSKTRK